MSELAAKIVVRPLFKNRDSSYNNVVSGHACHGGKVLRNRKMDWWFAKRAARGKR